MIKILGFLACAVSLTVFSSRYNAVWRGRAELLFALLHTVEHIKSRAEAFPDTLENIINEYLPKDAPQASLKESLLGYCRTGYGEIIPKDLRHLLDTADGERFTRFIKELGTGSLDEERGRANDMHAYLLERKRQAEDERDKTRKLSLTLTACALGGLLMLIL